MVVWFFFFLAMKVKVKSLGCVRPFSTPWTIAYQAPLSMGFSRQEYWSGLPFPSPGDLPDPGIEPRSSALQSDSLPSEPPGKFFFGNKSYEITRVFKLYMQRLIKICHICIYKCVHVCAAKLIYFNFYLYQLIYKDKSQGNFKISVWSLGLIGVQFSLVTQSCPTLCNPMNHSTPGLHWGGGPKICS